MRCSAPRVRNKRPRATRRREPLRAALEERAEPMLADGLHQAVRENLARTYRTLGDPMRRDVHRMIQREGSSRCLCERRCHQTIRAGHNTTLWLGQQKNQCSPICATGAERRACRTSDHENLLTAWKLQRLENWESLWRSRILRHKSKKTSQLQRRREAGVGEYSNAHAPVPECRDSTIGHHTSSRVAAR